MSKRKGSILITVLIMIAFLMSVVMVLFSKSSESYGGVVALQADNQGGIYAGTALAVIRSLMEYDDPEYDGLTDQWVTVPSIPVSGGFITVTIKSADDRLPANALANTDNDTRKRVEDAFEYAYSSLGYDTEMWKSLKDWVSPSTAVPASAVITGATFNEDGNSYTAKYGPLSSLYEVRLIPEYSGVYNDIAAHICVGEEEPKININFADNLTIRALLPELAPYVNEIIDKRSKEPFTSKDAIYQILGSSNRDIYTKVLPYFDVKSTLFYVKIEVSILDDLQYYHILMRRTGKRFTVVRYIEGRGIDYF